MAVVFVVVLFLTKNETVYKNIYQKNGLVYNGNEKVGDLINKDTDLDGVSDWQEGLFGTDPTKKDTNDDGIPDSVEIARMNGRTAENGELNLNIENSKSLTETDQLSREIFSTVATLNQTGIVDQETIDKLSESLANKIQEPSTNRKVFKLNDLKILETNTLQDVNNYNNSLNKIYAKYPVEKSVLDILQKFIIAENDNFDNDILKELDSIVKQSNKIITEIIKIPVPNNLAFLHLDMLNKMQKVVENIDDIKLYDADPIVAMTAISQYEESTANLELSINKLNYAVIMALKQ